MDWKENYKYWVENIDSNYKDKLQKLSENEKKENFNSFIEFGTAGIRTKRGWGTNKINKYTIAQFSYAFAKVLLEKYDKKDLDKGVIVIHDTRRHGVEYALVSAGVLSAQGIKVFLYPKNDICPTPLISHLIIKKKLIGGVNITASHNTKEYTGMKFYDQIGKQIDINYGEAIKKVILKNKDYLNIKTDDSLIEYLDESIEEEYISTLIKNITLLKQNFNNDKSNFSIVYTPNHGTGLNFTKRILDKLKYKYYVVKEQEKQDENFTNSPVPNPQFEESFRYAKTYGDKYNADLLIGSDPDADRFGVMVKDKKGKWILLSGNDVPIIQLYFLTRSLKMHDIDLKNYFTVKSLVTSNYAKNILSDHDIETYETFTGFKWITEKANEILIKSPKKKLLFAWEEANGSIMDWNIARDKDFFQSLINIMEIAFYYKNNFNKSLLDILEDIQKEYGYYKNDLIIIKTDKESLSYEDIKTNFTELLKDNKFFKFPIKEFIDFKNGYKDFPKTDILMVKFDKNSFIALRNSGTEPILKIYLSIENKNKVELEELYKAIVDYFNDLIKN